MQIVDGINHVAILTEDLARFLEFYRGVFELELLLEEATPALRGRAADPVAQDSARRPGNIGAGVPRGSNTS